MNYPGNRKRQYKAPKTYANRGKAFETAIKNSNDVYKLRGMAVIHKTDPPIQIQQTVPPNKVIGFKKDKGLPDFIGVSHGRAVAFEAKKTIERTNFPLKNIKPHQMEDLTAWQDNGGLAFFLIFFEKLQECYFVRFDQVNEWWDKAREGGRKSIPYNYFLMECDLVKSGRGAIFDYLKCVGI